MSAQPQRGSGSMAGDPRSPFPPLPALGDHHLYGWGSLWRYPRPLSPPGPDMLIRGMSGAATVPVCLSLRSLDVRAVVDGRSLDGEAAERNRTFLGHSCPVCGQRVLPGVNHMATTNPVLAAEWHPRRTPC